MACTNLGSLDRWNAALGASADSRDRPDDRLIVSAKGGKPEVPGLIALRFGTILKNSCRIPKVFLSSGLYQ
jgi:hypothetical protein